LKSYDNKISSKQYETYFFASQSQSYPTSGIKKNASAA